MHKLKLFSTKERGQLFLRLIDRYFGIPLCLFFGIFKLRNRKIRLIPKQIGLIIFGAIGDALLASCILDGLRKSYPNAKLILFVSTSNSGVSKLLKYYDNVCIVNIKNPLDAIKLIRSHMLDLLIDTSQWPRISALICFFSASKTTIGFNTSGQFRHYLYDSTVLHRSDRHEFDNFKELVIACGATSEVSVSLNDPCQFSPEDYNINLPYVVFHPWAAGYKNHMREWPRSEWINLASILASYNITIIITGGNEDKMQAISLSQQINKVCNVKCLAGELTLEQLTGCLKNAKSVVSVNTGVMHLASLLGCHVISLNGPTNSLRWGGIGPNTYNINIEKDFGGAYLNLGFEYPNNPPEIMSKISHLQVYEVLRKVLQN